MISFFFISLKYFLSRLVADLVQLIRGTLARRHSFRVAIPELGIKRGHKISDQMSEMTEILWALWWVGDNKPDAGAIDGATSGFFLIHRRDVTLTEHSFPECCYTVSMMPRANFQMFTMGKKGRYIIHGSSADPPKPTGAAPTSWVLSVEKWRLSISAASGCHHDTIHPGCSK